MKATFLSASALATFLIILPSAPVTVQASDSLASTTTLGDVSRIRIGNFGQVNANYYRGEQPNGRDYTDLAALGVRTVIDLQADGDNLDEEQLVEAAGMAFYRIPMTTRVPPTADQLAQFRRIVNDPAQQPVYVHCAGGKHRTGVMTAVYRIEQDGWTAAQAYEEMKQYKFGASFWHPEFKKFVYSYRPPSVASTEPAMRLDVAN
ncbi:MAG: tyrosine-protein phosphatase [Vicinamibacterales bacterium]